MWTLSGNPYDVGVFFLVFDISNVRTREFFGSTDPIAVSNALLYAGHNWSTSNVDITQGI